MIVHKLGYVTATVNMLHVFIAFNCKLHKKKKLNKMAQF